MGGLSLNLNSSNLKTKLNKVDRSKFNIKSPLNEILVGILLGDGHVQKRSLNGNSRFMYGQSSLRIHHLHLPSPDPAPTLAPTLALKGEGRREKGEGRREKGKG